jgi:hypothetical protein
MMEVAESKRKKLRDKDTDTFARLFDVHSAARYLGVSYWTARDLVITGIVPSVKLPCPRANDGRSIRRMLVDRRDLDELIEKNKGLD